MNFMSSKMNFTDRVLEIGDDWSNTTLSTVFSNSTVTMATNSLVNVSATMATNTSNLSSTVAATVQETTFQQNFRQTVYTYVLPVIYSLGLMFNTANLIVLNQKVMTASLYTYLSVIACTDLGACLWPLIYSLGTKHYNTYSARFYEAYFLSACTNFCADGSIWLTCMMALERLFVVRQPLKARAVCTKKRTRIGIAAILVFDLVVNIPRIFLYTPKYSESMDLHYLMTSEFTRTQLYLGLNWFYSVTINFIPLTILICSNLAIIITVQRAERRRKSLSSSQSSTNRKYEEKRLTLTLVGILFFSIICTLPSAFSDLRVAHFVFANDQSVDTFVQSDFYKMLTDVSNLFLALNFSVDTVVYSIFSQKFRKVMFMTFTRCCRDQE